MPKRKPSYSVIFSGVMVGMDSFLGGAFIRSRTSLGRVSAILERTG